MCMDCFNQYADEPVINQRVITVLALMKAHYEQGHDAESTTLLHPIVGDMNIDDCFFDLSDEFTEWAYNKAEPWERNIFDALSPLTEEERATVVALDWGYFPELVTE